MDFTSLRLGQLPTEVISLTDNIAHEVGTDLKRSTVQELADLIANYASTITGVGFRPANVVSGQTLPDSTIKEFILVGKGTFFNINGGATLTTTEELNALVSNGSTWSIGVEIPINVELAGIVQTIRSGFITTAPSENVVFNALALKASLTYVNDAVSNSVLVNDDNFKVLKTVSNTIQETFSVTDEALFKARGTELSEGGIPSINVDPTKFNITPAVLGQIKDGINYYAISYAGATAVAIDNIASINTYVYLDSLGILRQQTTAPTRTDFYSKLFLARFASNGTQLIGLDRLRNPSGQYSNSIRELYDYLISNNVPLRQGLTITGNANLTFNRAAGSVFRFGAGTDATPNTPTFTAVSPANFFIASRSSLAGALSTNVPVTQYDNNGVITTIANNKFVAHRLYFFTTPNMAIQYAQVEYASLDAAKTGAATEAYVVNPAALNGALLGWWIVGKNATDLTNPATSYFMPYTIGGGGSGVSVGALLASNNLSDVANPITALINLGGESKLNKQNSLVPDGTGAKYATVDAVNSNLVNKIDTEGARLDNAFTDIVGWGDSLTQAPAPLIPYTTTLSTISAGTVINKGISGETSTQIKDRLVADTANYSKSVIIWVGRNNYASPLTVKQDIATMISTIGHQRYLVVSILNGDYFTERIGGSNYLIITQLNRDLKALYGNRYVELREHLVSLRTNSTQDLIDFANDVPPSSLRDDGIHLNILGYEKTAEFFNKKLGTLFGFTDYMQSKDMKYYINNLAFSGIIESNAVDRTIWNNGKGNTSTNLSFGELALRNNTTGVNNMAIGNSSLSTNSVGINNSSVGFGSLFSNTSGGDNASFGSQTSFANSTGSRNSNIGNRAGFSSTSGSNNTNIGFTALFSSTTGNQNTSLGYTAGRFIFDAITANVLCNNSVFIGANTKPLADNQTNQTVIGYDAVGLGSNTLVLGNFSTVFSRIWGRLLLGTSTDNGADALQVAGTISASPATLNNQVIVKSQLIYNSLLKTSNYTILVTDFTANNELIISANATSGAFTITLPAFASLRGYRVIVKKMDSSANSITITGVSGVNIDGASTLVISSQYNKSIVGADINQYIVL